MIGVVYFFQPRELVSEKCFEPYVGQADGIEHAAGCFHDSWRRISRHWLQGKPFHNQRAEEVEVHKALQLQPVAEGPGRGDDRVLKGQRTDVGCEIR